MPQHPTTVPRRPFTVRRVALLLAGLLAAGAGAWYAGWGRVTPEKLFQEQFSHPRDQIRNSLSPIALDYREERCADLIQRASRTDSMTAADSLLTGIAYLQLNQPQRGASWLAAQLPAGTYHQDARYFLALTHLRERRLDEAYRIFQAIAADANHPYQSRITPAFLKKLAALKTP